MHPQGLINRVVAVHVATPTPQEIATVDQLNEIYTRFNGQHDHDLRVFNGALPLVRSLPEHLLTTHIGELQIAMKDWYSESVIDKW